MHRINIFFISLLTSTVCFAQISADASRNYVKTTTMLDANGANRIISIQYYDGFGRPSLSVTNGIGNDGSKVNYSLTEYDRHGREHKIWLPKPDASSFTGSDCAVTSYDILNRKTFVTTPGEDMQGHGTSISYTINTANSVKWYKINGSTSLDDNDYYPSGTLTCERTADADGKTTEVYKDLIGNVILERRHDENNTNNDTYYVYNDIGLLSFVLPPMYQEEADIDKYAYQYVYDGRGCVIKKKLPGCDWCEYSYDSAGHMIYSKDGTDVKRFYLYDGLGRLVCQGRCNSELSNDMQFVPALLGEGGLCGCGYDVPNGYNIESPVLELVNYYDNYYYQNISSVSEVLASASVPSGNNTSYSMSMLTGCITLASDGTYLYDVYNYDKKGNVICHYELSNGSLTKTETDYTFTNKPSCIRTTLTKGGRTYSIEDVYTYSTVSDMLLAKETTYDKNGNNEKSSTTRYDYDDLNNIASKSLNAETTNNALRVQYEYDVRKWITKIRNPLFYEELYYADNTDTPCYNGNISSMTWKVLGESGLHSYHFDYDELNRLTKATYAYDETPASQGIVEDMRTTVTRGISLNGVTGRTFESSRRYDEIISYNKNSAPTTLVRYGKTNTNSYSVIDNLEYNYYGNQLVQLDERNTRTLLYKGSFELAKKGSASVEYEYDANGNLTKDINKGISEITYDACNQPRTIKFDGGKSINYVYSVDGRKLSVAYISPLENLSNASANAFTATFDAVTAVEEPKLVSGTGTFSTVSASHNGDTSSSISDIQASANKTNLSSIEKIAFVAPELGKAIGEKINLVSNISVTEYVGNFIFENGNLTTCLTDDGYMSFTSAGKPEFHYYIKDHLGSNRIVADENGNIEQKTHYYAYGGIIGDISTNPEEQKFKYNGKEYETMHGLNTYDYGARQYDGAKIVWDRMDQLCEKYYNINPYMYCAGNPIRFIDPDGKTIKADSLSQNNIINTLTPQEAEYIQFDENGILNTELLNKCNSTSENFLSLRQLGLSKKQNYVFLVTDKDHAGRSFYDYSSTGGTYLRGITEFPGASNGPSPNENVYILVGACLSNQQQVMTTAHEAYGHGYLFDITGSVDAASHTYSSKGTTIWDEELKMNCFVSIKIPTNKILEDRLNVVVKQAKINYENRFK